MTWVRFTKDFDYYPSAYHGRVAIAYREGMHLNVTRECADKALASGRAVRTTGKRRRED